MLLISGEPGIGKTRLVEELARQADSARDLGVLWGRCWEGDGGPAFWPWTQCLRSYVSRFLEPPLAGTRRDAAAMLAQLVPEIREKIADLPQTPQPPDANQAWSILFDAVTSFLHAASRERALLLMFDDLHWATSRTRSRTSRSSTLP